MGSARHTCNCYDCVVGRVARKELQFGGTDWETDEDIPVRVRGKKKRSRKVCAKSKTGEPCDRRGRRVKGTVAVKDWRTGEWVNKPRVIECCSRCGRQWFLWHGVYY